MRIANSAVWMIASALLAAGMGIPARAQQVIDVPLATTLVAQADSVFVSSDAVAVSHGNRISVIRGLPLSPIASEMTLTGAATPAGPLAQIGRSTGIYRAVGQDLTPDTPDDVIAIVRNVLEAPVVEVTTRWLDPTVSGFARANEGTAVLLDAVAQQVVIIDHAATPAVITALSLTTMLPETDLSGLGRVDDDTMLAAIPGADGLSNTGDDELLTITGLAAGNPSLSTQPMPGAPQGGFFVTSTGVGVSWVETNPASVEIYLMREGLAGPNTIFVPVQVPINPSPFVTYPCHVKAGVGDSLHVTCRDDVGRGTGNVLLVGLSSTILQLEDWYDDDNAGEYSVQVAETEYVQYSSFGSNSFTHFNLATTPRTANTFSFPFDSPPAFTKPTRESLVATSSIPSTGARSLLVCDISGSGVATPHLGTGAWATDNGFGSGLFRLSRGLAAGFIDHGRGVDVLRVMSVPVISRLGPGKIGGPAELDLIITPTVPNGSLPVTVTLNPFTPSPSLAWVLVSAQTTPSLLELGPNNAFVPGSLLHLTLAGLVATQELPIGALGMSLVLDPTPVASQMIGQEYHVQAVVYDATGYYAFSDAFLVVPN